MTTIEKKRGDTWKFEAWIADDDGVAITDFTGYEIWFTIKEQGTDIDDDAVAQITLSGGGIVVTDAPTGKITGTVAADVTSEFSLKNHLADWQVRSDTDVIKSSSTATISCVLDITRAT